MASAGRSERGALGSGVVGLRRLALGASALARIAGGRGLLDRRKAGAAD